MSSYIPKQPKRERDQIAIKLDRDLLRKLELYGRFLESSRDYIISAALEGPIEWARNAAIPPPPIQPSLISGAANCAVSDAIRMSQLIAVSSPPPNA